MFRLGFPIYTDLFGDKSEFAFFVRRLRLSHFLFLGKKMTYTIDYSKMKEPLTLPEEEGRRIMRELLAVFEEDKLAPFLEILSYASMVAAKNRACLDISFDEKEKTGAFMLTTTVFSTEHDLYAREMLGYALGHADLQIRAQNGLVVIEGRAELK